MELLKFETIKVNLEESTKNNLNIVLIVSVIIIVAGMLYLKNTSLLDDKKFKSYFEGVYYDLVKYLFIESFLIGTEVIEHGKLDIVSSLGRISAVHLSLLAFNYFKKSFGVVAK